jgi:ABC-type proline/glycine betaine transport system ATPase subunit
VQRENPVHLRRGIGYVIQETGISRTAPSRPASRRSRC